MVAPEAVPVERPLRAEVGKVLQQRHEAAGVRFHLGTVPVEYLGTDRVEGVLLRDGTTLPADVVIEAVGCTPKIGVPCLTCAPLGAGNVVCRH